jgi:hypothetical protein
LKTNKLRKLWVSISGGRTSAYMAIKLKTEYSDRFDFRFIFANTGLEHEETLIFLDRIDKKYQLGIVWVEAVVHEARGKSSTHTIVDFETACRDGRLFEDMIDVYGIPNAAYPHCTRELKINPMNSYVKSIGWGNEFRAIGIRIDEMKRAGKNASIERKLYPLIDFFPTDKDDVLEWFKHQDFDLKIPEHLGNCVTCWKKTDTKLLRIIKDEPQRFQFFKCMEEEKGLCGHNVDGRKRVFFRQNRSVNDLFKLSHVTPELNLNMFDRCSNEECGMM